MSSKDTIVAISSPPGIGAVGVVRLSGEKSHEIGLALSEKKLEDIKYRFAYHTYLKNREGKLIDDSVIIFYKAPRTYTGEDMLEIFCHSGPAVLTSIFDECISLGARPAEPGEFTRRAFLNGKIDLAQVEAVADIVEAVSPASLEAALNLRKGALSRFVSEMREKLLFLLSEFEAEIDFEEEELLEMSDYSERIGMIMEIINKIDNLCINADKGIKIREGIRVALSGVPNVGKSSLMNALSKRERSIVTPEPGTTRDLIEEKIILNGLTVILIDTAGLREADSMAEREGVRRAKQAIEDADVVLYIFDSSRSISDIELEALSDILSEKVIVVLNKVDLIGTEAVSMFIEDLISKIAEKNADKKDLYEMLEFVPVSALTGQGIEYLADRIVKKVFRKGIPQLENLLVTNRRHLFHLKKSEEILREAVNACLAGNIELTAFLLREATVELSKIIGLISTDEIISEIFSRFCIGK
jgi:tRNA modification GTPase